MTRTPLNRSFGSRARLAALRGVLRSATRDRVAFAIGIANGVGIVLLIAIGYAWQLSVAGWVLGWLLISGLTNLLLAWNSERRLAAGRDRVWHEVVGRSVAACRPFERCTREYRGTVRLGPEHWKAVSRGPLSEGQNARVTGRRGLVLEVEPLPPGPPRDPDR